MLRLVDLSLDIYDHAPTFGPDPKTAVLPHMGVGNMGYNITQLILSTHLGTHLDAPFHFFDDGRTVENLDVRRGFGPAWLLDFSHKGPKGEITPEDMAPHADKATPGSRLIFRTGWDKQFPQPHYFSDQPYLGTSVCHWLVERQVATVALDMPTIYPADYITVHHILLRPEVLVIEGLRSLEQLRGEQVVIDADSAAELKPLADLFAALQF